MDTAQDAAEGTAAQQVVRPDEVAHRVDVRHRRVLLYRLESAFRTPDLAAAVEVSRAADELGLADAEGNEACVCAAPAPSPGTGAAAG